MDRIKKLLEDKSGKTETELVRLQDMREMLGGG